MNATTARKHLIQQLITLVAEGRGNEISPAQVFAEAAAGTLLEAIERQYSISIPRNRYQPAMLQQLRPPRNLDILQIKTNGLGLLVSQLVADFD